MPRGIYDRSKMKRKGGPGKKTLGTVSVGHDEPVSSRGGETKAYVHTAEKGASKFDLIHKNIAVLNAIGVRSSQELNTQIDKALHDHVKLLNELTQEALTPKPKATPLPLPAIPSPLPLPSQGAPLPTGVHANPSAVPPAPLPQQ